MAKKIATKPIALTFFQKHKEKLFLIFIFLFSIALRWYRLDQYLFFGFEQGRDAEIIRNIYQHADFQLVGPKTDLAGIFHGAYYYYLMIIPYALSGGNPVIGSFFLVLLSSLIPVLMYFFAKDFFASRKLGILTALLTAVSYEYIIYSRWLSNVTPGLFFVLLTFCTLWLYKQKKKELFFIVACVSAALAAQFELVLVLLFGFVFLVYLLTRLIPFPHWKTWLTALVLSIGVFGPHMLFNFRNQNIMFKSALAFAKGESEANAKSKGVAPAFADLTHSYSIITRRALSLPDQRLVLPILGVLAVGVFLALKQKTQRQHISFLLVWFCMGAPVLLFSSVSLLYQLYLGVGFSLIFLTVVALRELNKLKLGVVITGFFAIILFTGFVSTLYKLHTNQDVFFITIQEGMNYRDQQALLKYAHDDAGGQIYRLEAFTIPYLQQEGWQYLQSFLYPHTTDRGSKLVYIVIEKQVEPFWQKKWTEELGESTLVETKEFGLLKVEKRILK
jgi:4-amino-4-deoxy-L-arabinose transferase-like glycosyltransferase